MLSFLRSLLAVGLFLAFVPVNMAALKIEDTDFSPILTSNASAINPIFGLALYLRGQQFLLNLYQHGNPDHPLIKVLCTLFHNDIENEQIRPSANEANVAYGFGPYEVGWLLALLICYPEIFDDPAIYLKERGEKKDKKSGGKKEFDLFIKKLDETHKKRVASENPNRKKKDLRGTSVKKLLDFSNNALRAIQLGKNDCYNAEFVPLLFNTFACAKSKDKNDLFNFVVHGFLEHAIKKNQKKEKKAPADEYLTPYGRKLLKNKNVQKAFLNEKISRTLIEKTIAPYYATLKVDSSLPKNILFAGTAYLLNLLQLPGKISQLHIVDYENSPDCTEAAMLHLAGGILFDNRKGVFTPKLLPTDLRNKDSIKIMLSIFKHPDLNNLRMRTLWFKFLSKRPNIFYKKGSKEDQYCLGARANNIFELLNQLFSVKTTTWDELGAALSSSDVKISFTGPNLNDTATMTTITLEKTYPDESYYHTAIAVCRDLHAAIVESTFEQKQNTDQEKHIIFADRLMDVGMPPALYGAIVPLSTDDFQIKTIPHKKNSPLPFFLTLTRNIETNAFLELMRLADKAPGIKKLLSFDFINYNPDTEISTMCADWLLKSKKYEEQFFWELLVNNSAIFIQRAFFQKNYPAINFFLDTMLPLTRIKSSTHERTLLRAIWNQVIELYKNVEDPDFLWQKNQKKKPMLLEHRIDQKQLTKILKKLLCKDLTIELATFKKKVSEDLKHNVILARKIVEHDIFITENVHHFTYLYPHMLYVLLETAIAGINETNREICAQFLLSKPTYLEEKVYNDKTLRTLPKHFGDGFGIAKTLPEIKRARDFKKKLIKKTNQLQENSINQTLAKTENKNNLTLMPYIGK